MERRRDSRSTLTGLDTEIRKIGEIEIEIEQAAEDSRVHPGEYRALDPRYIPLQREVGRIAASVLSLALLIGSFVLLTPRRWPWCLALWAAGTGVLFWFFHSWPPVEYRYTSYRIDDDGIEIRSGVIWRAITSVPRSRVQHTDVVQGPFERRHGLGRLVIYTAGTAHSKVDLPGLAHQDAVTLRDHLLPREANDAV